MGSNSTTLRVLLGFCWNNSLNRESLMKKKGCSAGSAIREKMGLFKLKHSLLNLVRNFLIDDYSSWQIFGILHSKRLKSRDHKKKR